MNEIGTVQTETETPQQNFAELPEVYNDTWDNSHVRFPCSPKNVYQRLNHPSKPYLSRWYLIVNVLTNETIKTSNEFQEAVIAYNCTKGNNYAQYWDFSGLHDFFNSHATQEETDQFFNQTLPYIIKTALQLPERVVSPIELLKSGENKSITLTQDQIVCIMANGFLCTWPKQGGRKKEGSVDGNVYPTFSFHSLFFGCGGRCLNNQAAKLRCILHYFYSNLTNPRKRNVLFERFSLDEVIDWQNSDKPLAKTVIKDNGLIEDANDCVQVDFANKLIGGGVLGFGCIQEEIRFMINPELIASLLFTAQLADNEAVVITGAERYSNYKGYAKTFRFVSPATDDSEIDEANNRFKTRIVAMDALHFGAVATNRIQQYTKTNILRELNKVYCAFSSVGVEPLPIATGNWGCGAFGGYHDLKCIIQLLGCSQAGKELRYYTFQERGLKDSFMEILELFEEKSVTIGQVFEAVLQVSNDLFEKIRKRHATKEKKKGGNLEMKVSQVEDLVPQLFNHLFDRFSR
eukprot:CAMPEP_0174250514 /NCGR_PEP_ID=MMETSP0439-20130205/663_1 /TAXON_ID=0 /ORGANISM="Stereomyxa ramosa, Strain Chinc5" /LENGTH=517 /DNA_ID=CAMNT_0015330605 /DNA_START=591 /DNA_END=2144 /DNA_ORIENTATION=-